MALQELKEQAFKLSPGDRLALVNAIMESLQDTPIFPVDSPAEILQKRSKAIQRLRGVLRTDQPTPTDIEVEAMLEERRMDKYLR